MRLLMPFIVTVTLLSACGGPNLSPEQRAQRAINIAQTDSALADAKQVSLNGKTFRVAHVVERNQALVDLVGTPVPYYAADVEAASRAVTGCDGTYNGGILSLLGGDIRSENLASIRQKFSGRFSGWPVDLSCN